VQLEPLERFFNIQLAREGAFCSAVIHLVSSVIMAIHQLQKPCKAKNLPAENAIENKFTGIPLCVLPKLG
jgi:hypothetical protein